MGMLNLIKYLLIFILIFAWNDPVTTFEFNPGNHDRFHTPLTLNTAKTLDPNKPYYLKNKDNGKTIPVQVLSANNLVCLIDELSAGSKYSFDLIQGDVENIPTPEVSMKEEVEGIQVFVGGKPVLFYQMKTAYPGERHPDYYKRSGFIHPLQSPSGKILTDDFPAGHVHQHAIFNAWTNTTFKGEKLDFWNQAIELGTVEHKEMLTNTAGPIIAQLKSKLNHISLAEGKVLEEEWHVTVYPITDYFLFDLFSEQTNTSSDTLFINEYHYGGMAYRASREWNRDDTLHFSNQWKIHTSEGHGLEEANHTKAKWVDASGIIEGQAAGLTVFGFPENFRYPQSIRVHPDMPYWVFSPMVEGAFYIAPGQKFKSGYRYYVYDGMPDKSTLKRIQNDLENPVKVREL